MQYWMIPDFQAWLLSLYNVWGVFDVPERQQEVTKPLKCDRIKKALPIKHGWDIKEPIKECKPQIPIIVCSLPRAHSNLLEHTVR